MKSVEQKEGDTLVDPKGVEQMKMIHLAADNPHPTVWNELFVNELRTLGELTIVPNARNLPVTEIADAIRQCDVALSSWGSVSIPENVTANPGKLKYACHITGAVRGCIPLSLIDAGILVSNWGDAPANGLAEGAVALLFAVMKDLHRSVLRQRGMDAAAGDSVVMGSLEETSVGVYGMGVTGRRFVEILRPFAPIIRAYDPFASDLPPDCIRVATLEELFGQSRIVTIHAGLNETTHKSVTADLLARMPDHGIVINTARGAIVDHEALTREVCSGRLRAGLDVTDPEPLPQDHPLRQCPGCIITPHNISGSWPDDPVHLGKMHRICLDNLRRFQRGEPVKFKMDRRRYELST